MSWMKIFTVWVTVPNSGLFLASTFGIISNCLNLSDGFLNLYPHLQFSKIPLPLQIVMALGISEEKHLPMLPSIRDLFADN